MAFKVALAVANAKTNQDGRALLGVAADFLMRAYALVPDLTDTADVQTNARELLDRSNLYAQSIYLLLPNDGQPLSSDHRTQVSAALQAASSDMLLVQQVSADLQVDFWQALLDVIPTAMAAIVTAAAGTALDHWALTAGLALAAFLVVPWLLRRRALVAA